MGEFRGISIGTASSNRTRAAGMIAYCASDRIVKVSIESYLGLQHSLKIIINRQWYEQ